MGKRWIPLESNPDVLTRFGSKLGLNVSKVSFADVYGLDEDLLAMLLQPVYALVLLFPITPEYEEARLAAEQRLDENPVPGKDSVYFLRQTIGNACGTIALLHIIGNKLDVVELDKNSFLDCFYEATKGLSPDERGAYLENPPDGAPNIDEAHKDAAEQGDTAPPGVDEKINLHFVALLERNGQLWELDGRKKTPISHGATSPDTFLKDAAEVTKTFIKLAPDANKFSMMAFCSTA